MGQMGMSFADLCDIEPVEFDYILKAYADATEAQRRSAWEIMRVGACIQIQPHLKRKVNPAQLFHLPWDDETQPKPKKDTRTIDERRAHSEARFRQLEERNKKQQ